MKRKHVVTIPFAVALIGLWMIDVPRLHGGACDARVFPPHETAYGKTLAEWGGEWWAWAGSVPPDRNPVSDETGEFAYEGQSPEDIAANPCRQPQGAVFFLAGNFGGEKTVRTVTLPCGRALFFPVINGAWISDTGADPCPVVIAKAVSDFTGATGECEIDGAAVQNLERHREVTETCFCIFLPPANVFGMPQGTYGPSATAGYWLMLEPLCPGDHTIHFKGINGDFALEVTYNLTVEECPTYRRGDSNADGKVNIADAVHTLGYLFGRGEEASCQDAADANDDGKVNIADAIAVLGHLFSNAGPLPNPFSACGADLTADGLACATFEPCKTAAQ